MHAAAGGRSRKSSEQMSVSTPRAVVSATRFAAHAAFLMGIGAAGCSSFDPETDNCGILGLTPCTAGTGGTNPVSTPMELRPEDMQPEWRCLVAPRDPPPRPENPTTARVTYLVPVVDFDSPSPNQPVAVPNVQLTVCTSDSCNPPAACFPSCAIPPAPSSTVVIQQASPMQPFLYAINVPWGTEAVTLRASAPGYVASEYYVGGPMLGPPEGGNTVFGLPFFLLTEAARAALHTQVGLGEVNEANGILAARTLNCDRAMSPTPNGLPLQGVRAAGVRIEMVNLEPPESAVPWVLSFGRRASKDLFVTDDRGAAGFANLPPTGYLVEGIAPAPEGSAAGFKYGRTLATVRANTITIVEVREGQEAWGQ
jgi:hypothetical protein